MQRTIIFLLIVLLLPSVSAQDFLAFGDTTVNVVPCGTEAKSVTIQNARDTQASYGLSVDGDGSDYVTFSVLNFVLEPGQSATINTLYSVPCNVRPGTYSTDIYFTDGEVEKILTQELIVATPDNINISSQQTSAVIAPCETAGYTLDLHNPLNFTEIYAIQASGHPNAHVSEKNAVIQGGERKNIIVSVTPEDCAQSGTFPIIVALDTEKSGQHEELGLELIIKSTDIPLIAEGVTKIRTDYVDSTADLTIENTGDKVTQYSLSVEGVPWASMSPSTVSLNPGQSKSIGLRLNPTKEVPTGSYPISLTATVEQTGIKYSKELVIKLMPPTFFEKNPVLVIAVAVVILAVLIGIFSLIRYLRSLAFKERLRRWKEKREARRKAKAQKRAEQLKRSLEQRRIKLERKQAERERIKKQLEREYKKEYHVVSRKDLVVGKHKRNALKIIAIIFGILILILIGATWNVIAPNLQYVLLGLIILVVIFSAKKMARNRVIKAHWKVLLAKQTTNLNAWKRGLSLLSVTAKKPIKQFRLLVRKIRARVAPSPAVYQTLLIKTNTPEESTSFKATFTIPKQWLARKGADSDDVRLARYANQTWNTIPLKKTGESKEVIHFTADISKPGTYSIFARVQKQKPSYTNKTIWSLIGIALIVGIALAVGPQSQTIAHGIPSQVWQQDLVHSINLSRYFKDPDGDKLKFTATETKHVTIDIVGGTAFLTPQAGWTGEERVRFMATDDKGATIASNTVPLRVQKNLIPTRIQPYIAIILSILAIILLLFTVRLQNKR